MRRVQTARYSASPVRLFFCPCLLSHLFLLSPPLGPQVKMAALKFYKVDPNGKITRLRRECPSEGCGAGVFMASHFDRQYCGKCGLTHVFEAK